MPEVADRVWFEFVESKIFSKQVRELGGEILARLQSDLVQNPERGAVVKGTHGVRKARVADPASGRGKSGSYRYLYLYLNTPAEFTCSTCSARESKLICRRSRSKSSER